MEQQENFERNVASLAQLERRVLISGELPECMLTKTYEFCYDYDYDCPMVSGSYCPVRAEPDYRSYLLWLQDCYMINQKKRAQRIQVLKTILKRHKLPIHWGNLAILALQESPDLFDSADSVRALVDYNPDIFYKEEDGIVGIVEWRKTCFQ